MVPLKLVEPLMNFALKRLFSIRAITVVLVAVLALSIFNTYLIYEGLQSSNRSSVVEYDYVLSQNGDVYKLKNVLTGYVDKYASASEAINKALTSGKSIYINPGFYKFTSNVEISNKLNPKMVSDGATINGEGRTIVIYGNDYTTSQYAHISGLTLVNGTIRVENSFATTISDMKFINCTTAIEFLNTNTWSEYNKVESCQFINVTEGIVFRSPQAHGTGSYASSQIERCMFNLQDNSVGINVEAFAELSDSQLQDIRFWTGENGQHTNQTGLRVDGSMFQTLLFGVVFESFTDAPLDMYAIDLGQTCDPAPILDGGVSFLGNWTSRVHNPYYKWISADGSVFSRENIAIPVGVNNQFGESVSIQCRPLKISDFKPKLDVSFTGSQTVTVRVRIEYIDGIISPEVTRAFSNSSSIWLSDDEMLRLFSSQSVIWQIIVDAKSSALTTDASVKVSGYGIAG